jgi:general secretion pathway protein F
MFAKKFYDKHWNFSNVKFLGLLQKSKKALEDKNKKKNNINLNADITLFNMVSKKEVWQFINKFSIFINSWIDIKWTLNILTKQIKNAHLKKIADEIKTNIDYWISISETMRQYPKVFDNLTVSLIAVWETTGTLWRILAELDKKMIASLELRWKVKWAMIYPIILLSLTGLMVTFLMMFVVPKITDAFTKADNELPWLTQFIVASSNFMTENWLLIILRIVWTIFLYKLSRKTYLWNKFWWYIALKIPVFGYITRQSNVIYFIDSFTLLLDSWVLLLDALKISSLVVTNIHYKREIVRIKNEIESGLTMSKSLGLNTEYDTNVYLNKYFWEEFAYVVNTWEETWTLSASLKKVWYNYNMELKRYIWNLASMLEPFIIVIVWAVVWTIVIGIMLPFFELWKIAQKM